MVLTRIQEELKLHKIGDPELMRKLEDEKRRLMSELNSNVVGNLGMQVEMEKKVRMSKKLKTRNERIKNQQILKLVLNMKSKNKANYSKSKSKNSKSQNKN